MAGPATQKRGGEEVAREAVQPAPAVAQPSPFAQRGGAGETLTVAARFDAAAQSALDHKSLMLEVELRGPISREDTQHHRRRMNEEQQRAEASGNKELYDRAHMSWALMAGADSKLRDASEARASGDEAGARRLEASARDLYGKALRQEVLTERQMAAREKFGDQPPPTEYLAAERSIWRYGSGNQYALQYQDALNRLSDTYVRMGPALGSDDPRMQEAERAIRGMFAEIGQSASNGVPIGRAMEQAVSGPAVEAQTFLQNIFSATELGERLARMGGVSQELKKVLEDMDEELAKLKKKMEEGKATKEDIEKAKEISEFINDAGIVLEDMDPKSRGIASRMLSRAAAAMLKGSKSEAFAQRKLAKEYANAEAGYRKKLEEWSEKLAKGQMTSAEVLKEIRNYRAKEKEDYEKKPITERSATAFAGKLEAFIKSRKLDKELIDKKPAYASEIKDIRDLYKKGIELARKAEEARKAGRKDEASEYEKMARENLGIADAKLAALEYIQKLKETKAPKEMTEAARAAFGMLGTKNDWRARLILSAANLFISNKQFFAGRTGKKVLGPILGFLSRLAEPKNKMDREEAGREYEGMKEEARRKMTKGPDLDINTALDKLKGGPADLINAVKGIAGFIGVKDQQWRADFTLDAAKFYLDNRSRFRGKRGEALLAKLQAFVKMISDPEQKMSAEQQKEASEYLERLGKELSKPVPEEERKAPEKKVPEVRKPEAARVPEAVRKPEAKKPAPAPVKFSGLVKLRREREGAPKVSERIRERIYDRQAEDAAASLEKAGAAAELVKVLRESQVTDPKARAMMLDAAVFYANNMKTLTERPQMASSKKFFEDLITFIAGGKLAGPDLEKAAEILKQRKEFVGGFEKMLRSYMLEAADKSMDDLEVHRSYATDKLYREQLGALFDETKLFRQRIEKEEVPQKDLDAYAEKLSIAEQAGALFLNQDEPDKRKLLEPFLGRALKAAREGKNEEAALQLFLAAEILSAEKAYAKSLSAISADLHEGKATTGAARGALAQSMAKNAEKDLAELSNENPAKELLSKYLTSLKEKGEQITFDELKKLGQARTMISEIEQTEKLLSRKAYRESKEGAYAIIGRAATAFGSGDPLEAVQLQLYFARRFILEKPERELTEKASAGLESVSAKIRNKELDPASDEGQKAVGGYFAVRTLSEKEGALRAEQAKLKKGTPEWTLYQKLADELSGYRKKLAAGEKIPDEEAKRVEGMFMMFFGSRDEMLQTFGQNIDGMSAILDHVKGKDRAAAARIGLNAFEAWEKGDLNAWTIYARLMAAASSPDGKLRKEAISLANGYREGKVAPSKAEWLSGAYLANLDAQRGIRDRKLLKKADQYFAQAVKAYERGDLNGAQAGLDVLQLFSTNARLGRNASKEDYEFAESFLGEKGLLAQAGKDGITFGEAYAKSKGVQYSTDNLPALMAEIGYETRSRRLYSAERVFLKENEDAFASGEKRKTRQYGEESRRLTGRAGRARKKGDEAEASRLDEEASYVNYAWVKEMSGKSAALYRRGVELFDEAVALRKKALADPAKAAEYDAQAAEKERQSQNFIGIAGAISGGLRSFDRSVTGIWTNHRERGRENLRMGINGLAAIGTESVGAGAFTKDQEQRLQYYSSVAGVGNGEIAKQEDIQKQKIQFKKWFDAMEKQSNELQKRLDDWTKQMMEKDDKLTRENARTWAKHISDEHTFGGGYNQSVYYTTQELSELAIQKSKGEINEVPNWGTPKYKYKVAHSHVDAKWEMDKGRAYAQAENFKQARRVAKKSEAKLNWSESAVRSQMDLESLGTPYKKYGITEYYNVGDYERELEQAWREIERGNYDRSNRMVKAVSDRMTIDGGRQEMENAAWALDKKAADIDEEKKEWARFNPLGDAKYKLDSTAKKAYDDYIKFIKEHKATIKTSQKITDDYALEQTHDFNPYEQLMGSYDRQADGLQDIAKRIRGEIPKIKTVDDVKMARKAFSEIRADPDSVQMFMDPFSVKTNTDEWIKKGIMTEGGQAYLLALSADSFARKTLADTEQRWMIIKDSYSMAAENFMTAHYLRRTDKFEKNGYEPELASNNFFALADGLTISDSGTTDQLMTGQRYLMMPAFDGGKIGDVKVGGDAFRSDVPTLVGAAAGLPFQSYARMSGENFLGFSGSDQWDKIRRSTSDTMRNIIMASWGYGFNPRGGEVIDAGGWDMGGGDIIRLTEYKGAWQKMEFSGEERGIVLQARQNMKILNNQFFGDAIKMNDYIMSDASPQYFRTFVASVEKYGRAVNTVFDGNLNSAHYIGQREKDIRKAQRKMERYQKLEKETGDYKYYSLAMDEARKLVEFDRYKNPKVEEAQNLLKAGEKISGKTQDLMRDAASSEQWAGPIKVVGYGIVIVATGGTGAFVIGFKETVSAVKSFEFQMQMAGGYDNLSTKEKVMGIGGIALAALGAVSPAFTELGIAAHAPRLTMAMNWTLVGGGIAMGVAQVPDLLKAHQRGEMSGLGLAANLFANMQPALQIGIFGLRPTPIANKPLRLVSGILFGTPMSEYTPPLLERENYAVAFKKFPEHNRARMAELETRVGGLSQDEAIGVMNYFKDTPIPLEWAEQMVKEYRKSHVLPEGVTSIDKFQKVPLDAFANQYENTVPFPEVSGWAFPKPEQKPVAGQIGPKPAEAPKVMAEEPKVVVEFRSSKLYFSETEFAALHPKEVNGSAPVVQSDGTVVMKKAYHNQQHTDNVASTAHDLAMKREFTETDAKLFANKEDKANFLMQVGLLHDVDFTRDAGKPARVGATIEWMDSPQGKALMKEKFGWDADTADGKLKIDMAKAIIQRTEFPFDNAKTGEMTPFGPRRQPGIYGKDSEIGTPDNIKTRYDKMSPQEHYEKMLSDMDESARAFVMKEAPVLSEYADKGSWYFGKPKEAYDAVIGLQTEGPGFSFMGITNGFLKGIGQEGSFKLDVEIAKKFGVDVAYPGIERALELLGADSKKNWETTNKIFENISKAEAAAKDLAKAAGLGDDAQKAIGNRAIALAADAEATAFTKEFPGAWNENMRKHAAADPAKFAVAEHLFDAALKKAGLEPDSVRSSSAYGDNISKIMAADAAQKAALAEKYAGQMAPGAELRSNVKGFTSDVEVGARDKREKAMDPKAKEVLDVIEGMLGQRNDIDRAKADAKYKEWSDAKDPRAKIVYELTGQSSPLRPRMEMASPLERAIVAEMIHSGQGADVAFALMAREMVPDSAASFKALHERLLNLPEDERKTRLNEINLVNTDLGGYMAIMADPNTPLLTKDRLAAEWGRALDEKARVGRVEDAKANRDPDVVAREEMDALAKIAEGRYLDPSFYTEPYGKGGSEGRMKSLEALGLELKAQKTRLAEAENKLAQIEQDLNSIARDDPAWPALDNMRKSAVTGVEGARAELHAAADGLFELVVRGNLEKNLQAVPGFENQSMLGVRRLSGMKGVYEVSMTDGKAVRKLFVKTEDLGPAVLGAKLASNEGLLPPVIRDGLSYDTGVKDPLTGEKVMQQYGIMADIHELAGRTERIRLADGSVENVKVKSVAMLTSEILNNPTELKAILDNPKDPRYQAASEFNKLLETKEGRETLFQAWRAYHEMSRRAMLWDRHGRNTAIVVVERPDGRSAVTFQPIDMDGTGHSIYGDPRTGSIDLTTFNKDFAKATDGLLMDISRRYGIGMDTLVAEMFSGAAQKGANLPADAKDGRASAGKILDEYDQKPFGPGFDATSPENMGLGATMMQGGRARVIERADGRALMYADEARAVYDAAQADQVAFMEQQKKLVLEEIGNRVYKMADGMANGNRVPPENPGYELARRLSADPDFIMADADGRKRIAMEALEGAKAAESKPYVEIRVSKPAEAQPAGQVTTPQRKPQATPEEPVTTPGRKPPAPPAEPVTAPAQPKAMKEAPAEGEGMNLDRTGELAEFARKVFNKDKEALAQLDKLPAGVRQLVEELAGNSAFKRIAENDFLFKSARSDEQGFVADYARAIGTAMKKPVAEEMPLAAGGEGAVIAGPAPVTKPAKAPKAKPEEAGAKTANDEILKVLSSEGHAKTKEAYDSFLQLSKDSQAAIIDKLHSDARSKAAEAETMKAQGKEFSADEARDAAANLTRKAVFLTELGALGGEAGKGIESAYGLRQGELSEIYRNADSLIDARMKISERLGIETIGYKDDYIFGMLISGNLAGLLKELHPLAAKIHMTEVGEGATGAYKVMVTDSDGKVHTEFVKKVDMGPDKAGAENLRLSGIPAPEVITTNKNGTPLAFVNPENGKPSPYGMTRGIGDWSGTLKLAGKEVSLTADTAVSLSNIMNSPEIMDVFLNNPDAFWRQLGYLSAAGFAMGSVDAHHGNVFGMMLKIKDASPDTLKALQDAGYYVKDDKVFLLGRIDTDDSGGTYRASGEAGKMDFSSYREWIAKDSIWPKLLVHLTKVRNEYEAMNARHRFELPADKVEFARQKVWPVREAADGTFYLESGDKRKIAEFEQQGFKLINSPAEPQFVTVEQVIKQGFGSRQFYDGVKQWARGHMGDAGYIDAMKSGFRNRDGEAAGVSSLKLGMEELMRLFTSGVGYHDYPTNGEQRGLAFSLDNRTRMMADYEAVDLTKLDPGISKLFPENQTVYLVPVTKKQADAISGSFSVGEKHFAVFRDASKIPSVLKGKEVAVTQHGDVLRAPAGFEELTGISSRKLGAVHAFDQIMGMGEKGFMKEFMKMEEMFLDWERVQVNAAKENPMVNFWVFPGRIPADFGMDAYLAIPKERVPRVYGEKPAPGPAGAVEKTITLSGAKPAPGALPATEPAPAVKRQLDEQAVEDIGRKSMALRDAKAELDRVNELPHEPGELADAQTKYDKILKELGALMPNEPIAEVERRALGLDKKFTKEQEDLAKELAMGPTPLGNLAEGLLKGNKDAQEALRLLGDHPAWGYVKQLIQDPAFYDAMQKGDGSHYDVARAYSRRLELKLVEMRERAKLLESGGEGAVHGPIGELIHKAAQGDAEAKRNLADGYAKMKEPKNDFDALVLAEIERRSAAGKSRKDAATEVTDELLRETAKISFRVGLDDEVLRNGGFASQLTVKIAKESAERNGRPVPNAEDLFYAAALKQAMDRVIESPAVARLLGDESAAKLRLRYAGKELTVAVPKDAELIFIGMSRLARGEPENFPKAMETYMEALSKAKGAFGRVENADLFAHAYDAGLKYLVENAPPGKITELIESYAETASKLTKKINLGPYHSSVEEDASAKVFELASLLHIEGVKDPMAILANGKSGVVDLFLASPESFQNFHLDADHLIETVLKIPQTSKFKVQKKGKGEKLETVEVSRGQIIEGVLPWLLSDMSKLSNQGDREVYFYKFTNNLEWHSQESYRASEKLGKDPDALLKLAAGVARKDADAMERMKALGSHPAALIVSTVADALLWQYPRISSMKMEEIVFDASPYSKQIKGLEVPKTFGDRYERLFAESVKSGKPLEKSELPILLYAIKDPNGTFPVEIFSGALANDFFRKKMENRAVFDSVAGLLMDADQAMKDNSRGARAWLSMVEDTLLYLLVEETSSTKKPPAAFKEMLKAEKDEGRRKELERMLEQYILKRKDEKLKDSREDFASSKIQHLRNIWGSRNAIGQRGLIELADSMKGQANKGDFSATLGKRYVDMYAQDAKFTEGERNDLTKFALESTELFLQIFNYRKNMAKFLIPSNIPKEYMGKPESFPAALAVLDRALLAQARGEFSAFKFSEDFRKEMMDRYGKNNGNAIFEAWREEVPVLVESTKYKIYETGDFAEGFNCGIVKGATACQSPSNPLFFASSVIGSIELPWIKQVAIKLPGESEALYRRWLILVHGDDGKPVLLVQQEYFKTESFQGAKDFDLNMEVIDALKKRYEPLGIEVRPVSASNEESREQKNFGYGTFGSGSSPFFYMDSQMWSNEAGMAWHGHHARTPGKSVSFSKGWSKKHVIK